MAIFVSAETFSSAQEPGDKDTRPPACAGSWYPASADALRKLLTGYLSAIKPVDLPGKVVCLIAPHAGYRFSGQTAAAAFSVVRGKDYSRVILIGPSHYMGTSYVGGAIPSVKYFATPLGKVPLDRACCDRLAKGRFFKIDDRPHVREHCLEMELPLLQVTLKEHRIVPILMGLTSPDVTTAMAKDLRAVLDDRTLIVVSSDFTHYGPAYRYVPFKEKVPERLRQLDGAAIDRILAVDRLGFMDFCTQTGATICGRAGIALALEALGGQDVEGVLLAYTTSGAVTGDYTNSVSYAAIALCRGAAAPLSEAEQRCLLKLARDQVRRYLKDGKQLEGVERDYPLTGRLKKPGAAFVTLTRDGRLRGCIGHVVPVMPLYKSVLANAINACRDPRFVTNPVTSAEEPKLHIEISVLSRYRQIASVDEIKVGRDGLIIRRGRQQGLLLPQVPVQQKWNLQQYLEGLCRKAGLPPTAWKDKDTRIYRFTAQVFGEKHAPGGSGKQK